MSGHKSAFNVARFPELLNLRLKTNAPVSEECHLLWAPTPIPSVELGKVFDQELAIQTHVQRLSTTSEELVSSLRTDFISDFFFSIVTKARDSVIASFSSNSAEPNAA